MNPLENRVSAGICLPTGHFWLVESESFLPGSKHSFGTQAKASFKGSAETFMPHNDVMLGLYRAKIKIPGPQCVAVARVSGKRKWWFQGEWAVALYFEGEGRGSEGGITRSWTGHIRPNKVQCVKYFLQRDLPVDGVYKIHCWLFCGGCIEKSNSIAIRICFLKMLKLFSYTKLFLFRNTLA